MRPANQPKSRITLPSDREFSLTRAFAAPRRAVFDALTKPELLKRWLLGPPGWSMPVCEIDLRIGGAYRYVWRRDDDGTEMGMGGVYQEISPPDRLIATEKFDQAWYPGEALVTYTLAANEDGTTSLTLTVRYESREARDGVLKSDMETGITASYDRLAELLTTAPPESPKVRSQTP